MFVENTFSWKDIGDGFEVKIREKNLSGDGSGHLNNTHELVVRHVNGSKSPEVAVNHGTAWHMKHFTEYDQIKSWAKELMLMQGFSPA